MMSNEHLSGVINSLLHCLDDAEFPVCISAAISLQSYINNDQAHDIFSQNLNHIVERFILLLQKVAVEEVMQSFDFLINKFEEVLLPMSTSILNVLISAFTDYKQYEDNDNAVYTDMSTLDCISSIVMNGCNNQEYYDSVTMTVLPMIMNIFENNECDFFDAGLLIIRTCVNFYDNANTTKGMIWELFPHLLMMIQNNAIDYISGFTSIVDCYLAIPGTGMLDNQFNGKSYLELLYDFINSVSFDPEVSFVEQCYAMGMLMMIIHYYMSGCEW